MSPWKWFRRPRNKRNFWYSQLYATNITESINSFNLKQREVFNIVHKLAKDYVYYDEHNVELVHIFLSVSAGTGKYHLVKVIYNVKSWALLYHCEEPEKSRVLFFRPIGITAINIGGTTIKSGLRTNPGAKLLG